MMKQIMQWASEHWSDGIYCVWLGPGHPYLLTFKPEFAEVCGVCACVFIYFIIVYHCVVPENIYQYPVEGFMV